MRPSLSEVSKLILSIAFLILSAGALVFALKYEPQAHASAPLSSKPGTGDVGWTIACTPNRDIYALAWNTSTGESRLYWGSTVNEWKRTAHELPSNPFK